MKLSFPFDPRTPAKQHLLWIALYVLAAVLIVAPLAKATADAVRLHKSIAKAQARGEALPEKKWRGALGRWARDVDAFWRGENIYLAPLPKGVPDERPRNGWKAVHPNMPAVVVAITPFAKLPPVWASFAWGLAKTIAWTAALGMAIAVAAHGRSRMSAGLALVTLICAWDFYLADMSHANTNVFTAAAVVAHAWLYRRGHDLAAGVALAAAICLKLTPALFALYWLYQREWRLLLSTMLAAVAITLSPVVLLGPTRLFDDLATWWRVVIEPATVGGAWWPTQINQSYSGMISRLFIAGEQGNYLWDPDESGDGQKAFGSIAVYDLGPDGARWLLRAVQLATLAAMAVAIGWRRLPRDDGRRGLHYAMLGAGTLLLTQRAWDHHAVHLVLGHAALVYAIAYGHLSRGVRITCAALGLLGVLWLILSSGDAQAAVFGSAGADRASAYGTTFWHFLLVFALGLFLSIRLRRVEPPYAEPPRVG